MTRGLVHLTLAAFAAATAYSIEEAPLAPPRPNRQTPPNERGHQGPLERLRSRATDRRADPGLDQLERPRRGRIRQFFTTLRERRRSGSADRRSRPLLRLRRHAERQGVGRRRLRASDHQNRLCTQTDCQTSPTFAP